MMIFLFLYRSRQAGRASPTPCRLRGCANFVAFPVAVEPLLASCTRRLRVPGAPKKLAFWGRSRSRLALRPRRLCRKVLCLWLLLFFYLTHPALASERLLVAVTTSTDNSGLLRYLEPKAQEALGFTPEFIVTGSGKALKLGQNRDVDLLWVHAPEAEAAFMSAGHGLSRDAVMYNYFVLVGPQADPAHAKETSGILPALQSIATSQSTFISRGDDSGTHRREINLWRALNPQHPVLEQVVLDWYLETGSGMGATLNTATALNGYTLVDGATWLKSGNPNRLHVMVAQDDLLHNPYSIIVVADTGRSEATSKAMRFRDWLISESGQQAISDYRIQGRQGFFPNAKN